MYHSPIDQSLYGTSCNRKETNDYETVSDLCSKSNRGLHSSKSWKRIYLAHNGFRKTLTSFKASTLLKDNPDIEKCLFVVDRKDLDRQTREEFNKFQEGCVEENTNTETLVRRLLSESYADKVIVTTIQKLGLALDENNKRNQTKKKQGKSTYKERLEVLRDKRMVIIFDECHRSQFGENHEAIKVFFPNAQLFGFTGTPIFDKNSSTKQIDGTQMSFKTTKDIFEKQLHAYTITNAIADKNVLKFHIDFYKPKIKTETKDTSQKEKTVKPDAEITKKAIVESILEKHNSATNQRRFNAIFATSSINHAIEYYELFKEIQDLRLQEDENYKPLNIACVFSPPAEGNKDVQQLQEDLQQERADNEEEPEKKKQALKTILKDYNARYGTNHKISEFDHYYQDVQQRIKNQKYSHSDFPQKNKIDIVIVVDMLLTGFDSKYLNTLYVDKNLKYHGLIQAFSRTNRVLNDTKPYGNILDFRQQEERVKEAITLFSGNDSERAKEIWIVEPAAVVIKKLDKAVEDLESFMKSNKLDFTPSEVNNLKGEKAQGEFINKFKEIQKLKTQLDQYTDLTEEQTQIVEEKLPINTLRGFRTMYIETANQLKSSQKGTDSGGNANLNQLDFEFVLFSSAIIDYDYIVSLISEYTKTKPSKQKMSRDELTSILTSTSNLMEEKEDILAYINTLKAGRGMSEKEIRDGYQKFKSEKSDLELISIAEKYGLPPKSLKVFVEVIIDLLVFDGEKLSELMTPLELGWKDRSRKESELMKDLIPILKKLSGGREISGLSGYE